MINIAARQALAGKNVILFTLEMSEDMTAQRFDSIFSGYDINRIYIDKKKELVTELNNLKSVENKGHLIIKEFPTGAASVTDFKRHLYELAMRKIHIDIGYSDYLGLMRAANPSKKDGLYETGKQISVELRGLAFEFNMPMVSVVQLNRFGSSANFEDVDMTSVAESFAVAATCDFVGILGLDENRLTYTNELHYKIVKNRLGGRIGHIGKYFIDPYSLKMYDEVEMDE